MCVFAVDSLTNSCLAMPATLIPSASRRSTWPSRGDSCGPVGASRRFIASARSAAVNAEGALAACRAAATTSSAGAVFGTNALAPASRAPKSWSSPAYMVSTTMPIVLLVLRSARVASRPLPSGRRRSMITTSGWSAPAWRTASAAVAASPTTSNCRSRSNAWRRPLRMRSWSSTSSTLVRPGGVALVDIPGILPFWCCQGTPSRRSTQEHRHSRTVRVTRRDLKAATDTFRPFRHDCKTVASVLPVVCDAVTVIGHLYLGERGVHRTGDPEVRGTGVLPGIGDRLLRDPEQLRLGGGGQPGGRLVEREVHPQPGRGADGTGGARGGGGQPAVPVHLAAQLEEGQPQLGDHAGHLVAQQAQLVRRVFGIHRQDGQRVVDAVADHDQFLCHPVVDLPGEALPLLIGGQRADLVEEQCGLQAQRRRGGQRGDPPGGQRRGRPA